MNSRSGGVNGWLVAAICFFVTVLTVNVTLIYFSRTSWTGLTTVGHYQQGLQFNQVLMAQQAQEQLQWRPSLRVTDHGSHALLEMTLRDRDNRPVTGLQMNGALYRPVQDGHDQAWAMQEQEPGRYVAQVVVPLPGSWEVRLQGGPESPPWRFVERIQLRGEP
ncbi:MAG: FixH family protein [Magnetococcales bacterium]|nr:FixH family protein [Magnetococcales bacterium]